LRSRQAWLAGRQSASYSVAHCSCLCARRDELSSTDNRGRRTHLSPNGVAQHLVYRDSWRHPPWGATELGMAQWLSAYAETSLGYPKWIGGTALLLFSVAMAVGRMAIGTLRARLDSYTIMAWTCGVSVVLFLAGSFLPVAPVALLACILVGLIGSCLWPTMLAVTAHRYTNGGASKRPFEPCCAQYSDARAHRLVNCRFGTGYAQPAVALGSPRTVLGRRLPCPGSKDMAAAIALRVTARN
jgi:hypothetical protein